MWNGKRMHIKVPFMFIRSSHLAPYLGYVAHAITRAPSYRVRNEKYGSLFMNLAEVFCSMLRCCRPDRTIHQRLIAVGSPLTSDLPAPGFSFQGLLHSTGEVRTGAFFPMAWSGSAKVEPFQKTPIIRSEWATMKCETVRHAM